MKLQCGDIVSLQETHPYIICMGNWHKDVERTYVLVNLRDGCRWSDREFTLPISEEELGDFYCTSIKYEGKLK